MPFLISVLMLYVPLPLDGWTWPWHWTVCGVSLLAGVNGLACWMGVRLAGGPQEGVPGMVGLRAARVFNLIKLGIPALVFLDVFALKWPLFVEQSIGRYRWLVLLDDLVMLLPVLVMIGTAMAFRHRLEARHRHVSLGLWQYLWLRFRVEVAVILAAWMVLVFFSDLAQAALGEVSYRDSAEVVVSLAVFGLLMVAGPALLSYIWDTSPLPEGPLRTRLEELCRAHRFRYRDILVWHTHHHLPNAGVVGPFPWLRYVLLSDALLRHCSDDEIEAVFAHEVGHVRYHHLGFYMLFALAFLCFYANLIDFLALAGWAQPLRNIFVFEITPGQALIMLLFALLYWVLLFGFLSRRLEQQADLFSLGASRNPLAFISALGKLSVLSHTPSRLGSWRHFSIQRRADFLRHALARPAEAARPVARTQALQGLLLALFLAALLRLIIWRPELLWL